MCQHLQNVDRRRQGADCVEKVRSDTSREIAGPARRNFISHQMRSLVAEGMSQEPEDRSSPSGISVKRVSRQPDFFNTIGYMLAQLALPTRRPDPRKAINAHNTPMASSRCGGRNLSSRPSVVDHYAVLRERTGMSHGSTAVAPAFR